ncbi:DNA polymerase I [bacterium]|nr:DNA polymerase I [bacterium]
MDNQKTLILIDGHALAFRQYYALERTNMKTSDGTPSWAVYGFFKAIFDLLKNKTLNPDAIAVAFDVSHQTFRVEKYPEYKSNRVAMPDPMQVQMGLIYEGLKAFNIPIYTKTGFEADDVIGTISKKACELGHKVLILTGDQDAFQLVDECGCVKVILPSKGELVEYNWEKIFEKLGVYPNQVIDYKALRGDTSDCIPGIKGIGEKTAQKLLGEYKTLENLLANCENIKEKSVKAKVCEGIEIAKLSQYLATIVRDVDIDFDFSLTNIELPDVQAVTDFLTKMQFYSFLRNINSILTSFDKNAIADVVEKVQETPAQADVLPVEVKSLDGQQQLGLFSTAVQAEINKFDLTFDKLEIDSNEKLNDLVQKLEQAKIFSFKVIADLLNPVEASVRGFAFGINSDITLGDILNFNDSYQKNTVTYFVPVCLDGEFSLDSLKKYLKDIFENENIKKITYDLKTEYNVLKTLGIDLAGVVFDVQLASYINDPSRNHDLDVQAIERLNHLLTSLVPAETSKKKKFNILEVPSQLVFDYGCDAVATIIELTAFWAKTLGEKDLKLLSLIEIPLAKVLAEMEQDGVSINVEYLNMLSNTIDHSVHKLEKKIYDLAGEGFNINSPRQVGEILFEKLQLGNKKRKKGKSFSTSAEVLEELAEDYEIADLILQYRKFTKLKSTYTEALPALINPVDNRIHTTFNQTITATGRLSSSNPNLQNIPIRTEEGNKIRNAFVPENTEDYLIMSADYSQIELRLLAHISEDKNLIDAFNSGEDVHTLTASKVFEVPIPEVTKEMRYKAKAVNFGIIYGQSKYGLAKALGITADEAESFINKYFITYPGIKRYMDEVVHFAEKNGFVESLYGRRRTLENELASSNAQIREFAKRAAINHPMQGTAADLIKLAMIEVNKNLKASNYCSKMIMQVHDELVLEVKKSELAQVKDLVVDAMELNQPFSVPLLVDVSVGATWKE